MARRARRHFTAEQKAQAVRLVKETGNLSRVAQDLDLTRSSLVAWVRQAEVDAGQGPGGALTTEEKAELTRLRREVPVRRSPPARRLTPGPALQRVRTPAARPRPRV